MSPADRLVAIEEVRQLKAKYFLALDCKDAPAYAAVFTSDGVFDLTRFDINGVEAGRVEPGPVLVGGPAIAEFVLGSLEGIRSAHRGFNPVFDVIGPDEVAGTWAMEDWFTLPGGKTTLAGSGYYHDKYVRRDGRWLIQSSELERWSAGE